MGFDTLVSRFGVKLVITIPLLKMKCIKPFLSFFFETSDLVKDYPTVWDNLWLVLFNFFFFRINIAERTVKIIFLPTR